MSHYELVVHGDDDVTPLFEVGTDPAHANPYLHMPDEFGESDVDLMEGKAQIGQINARIIDPQTGATKAVRWLTALLGNASGYSALNRRRALLRHADGTVVQDGIIGGVSLNDSFAGFSLPIRDMRERGRKVPCFTDTDTPTVVPRGVKNGYGLLPNGEYLIAATQPLTGTYTTNTLGGFIAPDGRGDRESDIVPADLALSAAQIAVLTSTSPAGIFGLPVYDKVRIRWRVAGSGGAYNEIHSLSPGRLDPFAGFISHDLVQTKSRTVITTDGREVLMPCIYQLRMNGTGVQPLDGQDVEFIVDYIGPVSEDYPFHFEGTWGELVANLLDGDYSPADPRIRYDAVAVAAIDIPVRVRLFEPIEDIRVALEQLCKPIGGAPALDSDGEIAPIRYALPDTSQVLAQIDDSNCTAIPGWEHPADTAITAVEVTYQRDYRLPAKSDPEGNNSGGDGLASRDVIVRHVAEQAVLDVMGEQDVLEIDAWMFRALGGDTGGPVSADVRDEIGHQQAEERARQALDRAVYGMQSGFVRLMASDFPGLSVGDWLIDARPWVPNYATGQRGGNALVQVVSVQPRHAWIDCRIVYAGPADALLAAPTFDTSTETGGVITVTALTAPADVEVQYAIGAVEPAANSGLWTFMGRRTGPGTVVSSEFTTGITIWLRGRSTGQGRRPSAWVDAGSVVIAGVPRVRSLVLALQDDGSVIATWQVNPNTAGIKLYYEAHAPGVEPTLASFFEMAASLGSFTFSAAFVGASMFTVEAEPYPTFSAGSVSGTPGDPVRQTVDASQDVVVPDPFGTVTAYLGTSAQLLFDAHGNADGVSFGWAASKTAIPAAPTATINARESLGVDTGLVLASGETGFVAVWWYPEAAGGGVLGERVADQVKRGDELTAADIADNAITTAKLASEAVTAAKLAALAVTEAKVAASAISTAKLAADAVTAAKLADDAVGTEHIQALAVTAAEVASSAVTTAKIAASAVDAGKLAANAVTETKILDRAVTALKVAEKVLSLQHLVVGSFDNLAQNPGIESGALGPHHANAAGGTWTATTLNVRSGTYAAVYDPAGQTSDADIQINGLPTKNLQHAVTEGDSVYAEAWVRRHTAGAANRARMRLRFYDAAGVLVGTLVQGALVTPSNTYVRITVSGTAPAGAVFFVAAPSVINDGNSLNSIYFDDMYARRMVEGSIVVDGTITAQHLAANTVTANEIAADAITATELAAGAVTTAKLDALAVTAAKIAAGTITSDKIAANAVTATQVDANAITASKIAASAVTAEKIVSGAVTTAKLDALAVTTAKIDAGAVTADKMTVANLAAIVADLGTITAGILNNTASSPTMGIRLNAAYSKPGTWLRYIDFANTGATPFLEHEALTLLNDGTATFSGELVAASGTFGGDVVGGSFTVKDDTGTTVGEIQGVWDDVTGNVTLSMITAPAGIVITGNASSGLNVVEVLGTLDVTDMDFQGVAVSIGAANSAGAGFRQLRVPN